jgi:hypothetical protein
MAALTDGEMAQSTGVHRVLFGFRNHNLQVRIEGALYEDPLLSSATEKCDDLGWQLPT